MLQIQAIGSPSISTPITLSGTNKEMNDFIANFHINESGRQSLGNNDSGIDKAIIKGTTLNGNLEKMVNYYSNNDTGPFSRTVPYGLGILPNPHITSVESRQISESVEQLMKMGLKEIVQENDGVKVAECRSKFVYNDNKETLKNFYNHRKQNAKSICLKEPVQTIIKQNQRQYVIVTLLSNTTNEIKIK